MFPFIHLSLIVMASDYYGCGKKAIQRSIPGKAGVRNTWKNVLPEYLMPSIFMP
jgi:hypothetical protein